jgi:hypothetical protein
MDESSSEYPYVAAGWAARPDSWQKISDRWKQTLDAEPKLGYFKLNDALALKGSFKGWTEPDRDAKLRALTRAIPHDGSVFGVGCHVRRDVFEGVVDKIPRKIYRDPYYLCVATTMIFSAGGETQIVGVDKIDFILDHSRAAERMRKLFYADIKPAFPKLGECLTMDDKETMPLQAADLTAGATRQLYEPSPRDIPGIGLLNGLFSGVLEVTRKGLLDAVLSPAFNGKGLKLDPSS